MSHHAEDHLESFLHWLNPDTSSPTTEIRPDFEREQRKGTPEVIFGETKETSQIVEMADAILAKTGRAIISRVRPETVVTLRESFPTYDVRERGKSRMVSIYRPDYVHRSTGGQIGVISAGTSDIPVAEEAAHVAEEMGCEVTCIYDVGVAGLHRLVAPLKELHRAGHRCNHCGGRHGWRVAVGCSRVGAGARDRTTDIDRLRVGGQGGRCITGDVTNVRAGSRLLSISTTAWARASRQL